MDLGGGDTFDAEPMTTFDGASGRQAREQRRRRQLEEEQRRRQKQRHTQPSNIRQPTYHERDAIARAAALQREKDELRNQLAAEQKKALDSNEKLPPDAAYKWIIEEKLIPTVKEANMKESTLRSTMKCWAVWDENKHKWNPMGNDLTHIFNCMQDAKWRDDFMQWIGPATDGDTYMTPTYADSLNRALTDGRIVPLYNGFGYFGQHIWVEDDDIYRRSTMLDNTEPLAANQLNVLYINDLGHYGQDAYWCVQLGAMEERGPDVVSQVHRFYGNYLMIPIRRPKEYSIVISFGLNLYVFDIADDDMFRRQHCNPAYANTYLQSIHHITGGHFSLSNLLMYLTCNTSNAPILAGSGPLTRMQFAVEFEAAVMTSMRERVASWGILSDESPEENERALNTPVVLLNRYLQSASCIAVQSCGQHARVPIAWNSVGYLGFTFDASLFPGIMLHKLPVITISKYLARQTFVCNGGDSNPQVCALHYWREVHPGRSHYCYDVSLVEDRLSQISRHKHHRREIQWVTPKSFPSEDYWSSMVVTFSKAELLNLKNSYNWGASPYLHYSPELSMLATEWHVHAPTNKKFVYDAASPSIIVVSPAKFRIFLDIIETRFNGTVRMALHGTMAAASVAEDPNGFNRRFASSGERANGAAFGEGIYLGFDANVAHNFNKKKLTTGITEYGKKGNVLFCLAGWDKDVGTIVQQQKEAMHTTFAFPGAKIKLKTPLATMFKLHCFKECAADHAGHWDGASFDQPDEILVMGEINEVSTDRAYMMDCPKLSFM